MVFYCIVCATLKSLGDFSPLVLFFAVLYEKDEFLFKTPLIFFDSRVKMIVPSLSTLFADASRQVLCDRSPLLSTSCLDKRQDQFIFFFTPRTLYQLWVQHFLPSMQTLNISTTCETFGNFFPVLAFKFFDGFGELCIFLWSPVTFVCSVLIFCRTSLVNIWVF